MRARKPKSLHLSNLKRMWRHFIRALPMTLAAMLLTAVAVLAAAGTTDSSSGPTTAGSQMYTLDQIYELLDTGITSPKMTAFTEPLVAPGTGSMVTLDDLMAEALANRCNCASGTLYGTGTRWCINGDGTVTDLNSCLVWIQNPRRIRVPWDTLEPDEYTAHTGIAIFGSTSVYRLPTLEELLDLTAGLEGISAADPGPFRNIQADYYWSSSNRIMRTPTAYAVNLTDGSYDDFALFRIYHYLWPVKNWD